MFTNIEIKTWNNSISPNDMEKGGYQIQIQNTQAPITLKQLYENKTYINSIGTENFEKGG